LVVSLLPFLPAAPSAAASLLLNEVHYDPEGTDEGREFVELAAPASGDPNASLEGWILETGNGAEPGAWTVAWVGHPWDSLRVGLFVIGEADVEPRPDAVAELDLQNGPDSCRLRGRSGAVDVLGWGSPLDSSFFEGSPAEDGPSGLSLARLPDGFDTDHNDVDFRPATPSPGSFNAPDSSVVLESFAAPPEGWPRGSPWTFEWVVRNSGRLTVAARLEVRCDVHPLEEIALAFTEKIAPGETARAAIETFPPAGVHLPRSTPPSSASGVAWRGHHEDLLFTEALTRPETGGPEWIELLCVAATDVELASFELEDAAGTRGVASGRLRPGQFAVLTADSAEAAARWQIPSDAAVLTVAPWPSLNHSGSLEETAERIALRVKGGLDLEAASLPGGADANVSWERISRSLDADRFESWAPSLDPSGSSPGRANSRDGDRVLGASPGAALSAHPPTFRPTRDGTVLLVLRPGAPATSCRMTIHDAEGNEVAELRSWRVDPLEHRALWDGRDRTGASLPLGVYVVRAQSEGGKASHLPVVMLR
jgi:hypothetical protein